MTDRTRFVPAGPAASPEATPYSGVTVTDYFRREGLLRPKEGRWLAGVCAGLGRRYGMSAAKARLLQNVAKALLAPAPARLGAVAKRIDEAHGLVPHLGLAGADQFDRLAQAGIAVHPLLLDLAQPLLVAL